MALPSARPASPVSACAAEGATLVHRRQPNFAAPPPRYGHTMTSGPTDDYVSLRLAVEDDLPLIESLTWDPDVAGEFAQFGWFDPRLWRRHWEENELLGPDGGLLMVMRRDERLGFVNWRRKPCTPAAYYLQPAPHRSARLTRERPRP